MVCGFGRWEVGLGRDGVGDEMSDLRGEAQGVECLVDI
jgi:hypothetical protein